MKTKLHYLLLAAALTSGVHAQLVPDNSPDGITIGGAFQTSSNNLEILPFDDSSGSGTTYNTSISAYNGGIALYSKLSLAHRDLHDGGIGLLGSSLNMILRTDDDLPNQDTGSFNVWRGSDYYNTTSPGSVKPLFQVTSVNDTATFNSVDVVIADGTLKVGTSPVLTEASSPAFLGGLTPPTTSAWTNTYLTRGNVTNGAAFAFGTSATSASGVYSMALGHGSTATHETSIAIGNGASAANSHTFARGIGSTASGSHSTASGVYATAGSTHSMANGDHANASGRYSFSHGLYTSSTSSDEATFGRYNIESTPVGSVTVSGLDGLFRLGNGSSTGGRSDAMTVLKCGETTLTNKDWKAAVTADPADALEDPASITDKGGNALVVDGHAVLNGKVTISVPQGDLSMGAFTAP